MRKSNLDRIKAERNWGNQYDGIYIKKYAHELERENQKKNKKIKLGPKSLLYHYIYDLKIKEEEAIKKLLDQFPTYSEEILKEWIKEKEISKNDKNNSDNCR